jgi:tetratricopeptide (TPR) repeat protein
VNRLAFVVVAVALAGCPRPQHPAAVADASADPPIDLVDEVDFDLARDRMWAMPTGAARGQLRAALTAVLIDRAGRHLGAGKYDLLHADLLEAADLFSDEPDAIAAALAPHVPALTALDRAVARSGADRETATTLVLLIAADPDHADGYRAALDEVLGFVDDLAASEHGEVARGAAPIATLAPIARALPLGWLTDRYVKLLADRQARISYVLDHEQASFDLVAAHRDVAGSARAIATMLARAGRAPEIAAAIGAMHGIGEDPDLAARARRVATGGVAADWVALARALRDSKTSPDPEAALAVCKAGLARFPADPTLAAAAAEHAAALGRVEQPIALDEAARAIAKGDATLAHRLAGLYRERLARLSESGRAGAARAQLAHLEAFLDGAEQQFGAGAWRADRAAARIVAGKGLLGQGDVDGARDLLARAVEAAPSAEGFQALATIAIAHEQWDDASRWTKAGLDLPEKTPEQQFQHAKTLRLFGDAAAGAGQPRAARNAYLTALQEWADLGDKIELPPGLAGERMIESAKVLWSLGEKGHGVDLLDAAMDVDDDGSNTYVAVVEFLLGLGELDHAADAVHRAIGADGLSDYNKIYVCLYLVAEAEGAHRAVDPLALAFLRARQGALWPDDLARLATGRADVAGVSARATTRARQAELAYYRAMLDGGLDAGARRALFDRVIASDLITFFEWDMARRHTRGALGVR